MVSEDWERSCVWSRPTGLRGGVLKAGEVKCDRQGDREDDVNRGRNKWWLIYEAIAWSNGSVWLQHLGDAPTLSTFPLRQEVRQESTRRNQTLGKDCLGLSHLEWASIWSLKNVHFWPISLKAAIAIITIITITSIIISCLPWCIIKASPPPQRNINLERYFID